ncbi:MAG: hypothetical protein SGPRY_001618 [Prymnesium sp.]
MRGEQAGGRPGAGGGQRRSPRLQERAEGEDRRAGPTAREVADMSPGTVKRVLLALLDSGSGTGVGGDGRPHTSRAETARSPRRAREPPGREQGCVGGRRGQCATEEDWVGTALGSCGEGGEGSVVAHLAIPREEETRVTLGRLAQVLAEHQLPDAVAQFAHAAGDTLPTTRATAMEGRMLLKNIELAHLDMISHDPRLDMRRATRAKSWEEGVQFLMKLLAESSSLFRTRRVAGASMAASGGMVVSPQVGGSGREAASEKPPVGSFKAVTVAADKHKAGACRSELLEGMAAVESLRREHLRQSAFKDVSLSTVATRDAELTGELTYFHSSYGQGALAYIMSNGMCTSTLSGSGVPMALHNVRAHLLARARKVIDGALGEAKASAIGGRVDALEVGFLAGVSSDLAKECVALLGGAAPGEEAEIEEEGGSVSSGSFGKVTGEGAAAAIRDAFSTWAEGMGATLGAMPGVDAGPRADFGMSAMLRRIKGRVGDEALLYPSADTCSTRHTRGCSSIAPCSVESSLISARLWTLQEGGSSPRGGRTSGSGAGHVRSSTDGSRFRCPRPISGRTDQRRGRGGRTRKGTPQTLQRRWRGDVKRKWREEGAAVPSPVPSASRLASDLLSSLEHTVVPVVAPTESPAAAKKGRFMPSAVIKLGHRRSSSFPPFALEKLSTDNPA